MKLKIKVKPNSSREKVEKIDDGEYKVYLKKPAREGKANSELIKVLKKYFGAQVKIVRGFKSREKIVELN